MPHTCWTVSNIVREGVKNFLITPLDLVLDNQEMMNQSLGMLYVFLHIFQIDLELEAYNQS